MKNKHEGVTRFFAYLVILILGLPSAGLAQDLNEELWAAARKGDAPAVTGLLEKGAEGKDDVLMVGLENNGIDMVNTVLAVGGLSAETLTSALTRATQNNKTEIVEALKEAGAAPAKVPDFKIDPGLLQNYVGRYKNDEIGMERTFTVQNDKLIGSVPGQPALTYAPVDNNSFKAVEFSGIEITFNSTNNQVADFTLKQGGRRFVFKKVKAEEKIAEPKSAEVERKEAKLETAIATTANKVKKNGVAAAKNWPSFRGLFASGVADGQNPPTSWNAEKSLNIKWKTPIPGMAHSSPAIY